MQARPCGQVCVAACVCTCAGGPAPMAVGGGRRPAPAPRPGLGGAGSGRHLGCGSRALRPCPAPRCPPGAWALPLRGLPLPEAPWASPPDLCLCLSPGVPPVPAVGLCDPAHPPGPSPHLRCLCGPPVAHRAAPPEAELPEAPQARLTVSAPQIRQGWRRGWMDEWTHLCLAGMSLRKQGRQLGAQEGPCPASLPTLPRKAFLGTTSKCHPVLWLACLPTLHTQRPRLRELEVLS